MKRIVYITFVASIIIYFITANYIYQKEYDTKETENKISQKKQQINDINIQNNTDSSKTQARKDKELKFRDNIYYLK